MEKRKRGAVRSGRKDSADECAEERGRENVSFPAEENSSGLLVGAIETERFLWRSEVTTSNGGEEEIWKKEGSSFAAMEEALSDIFHHFLSNPVFREALDLVQQNSSGKIWVTGGFVYRNLAAVLYGGAEYDYDIDFVVEKKNEILKEMSGWRIAVNSYGKRNYVRDGNKMSFTQLNKIFRVGQKSPDTIEQYFSGTPLNIQSIAYDFSDKRIMGTLGIRAVAEKIVAINNGPQAEYYVAKKNKTVNDWIAEKAKELGFRAVFPD